MRTLDTERAMMATIGENIRRMSQTAVPPPAITFPDFDFPATLMFGLDKTMRDAVAAVSKSFHDTLGPALKAFSAFDKCLATYETQACDLGRCGWTLPMNLAAAAIPDLLEGIEANSDYDGAFLDFYTTVDGASFDELQRALERNKRLAQWHPLLTECFACYRHAQYRVVVPALLVVFEGACALATNSLLRSKDPKASTAARRKSAKNGTELLVWASLEGFTSELFRNHNFSDPAPERVNRHWISHGRALTDWSRADALRLFQAINTVA